MQRLAKQIERESEKESKRMTFFFVFANEAARCSLAIDPEPAF